MTVTQFCIAMLLGIGLISTLLSCLALLLMKDLYERLHYLSPPATVGIACFSVAVIIDKPLNQAAIKSVLILIVLLVMNAVLTHATARAARVRQFGCWNPNVRQIKGDKDESSAGRNSRAVVDKAPSDHAK